MPRMPVPNSEGFGESGEPERLGGEVIVSRAEAAALTAIHFSGKDPKRALQRASAESGLSPSSVLRLQHRSDLARSRGVTIKGERLVLKPLAMQEPDVHGLLGDEKLAAKGAKGEAKQPAVKRTKEGLFFECSGQMDCACARHRRIAERWSDAARAASIASRRKGAGKKSQFPEAGDKAGIARQKAYAKASIAARKKDPSQWDEFDRKQWGGKPKHADVASGHGRAKHADVASGHGRAKHADRVYNSAARAQGFNPHHVPPGSAGSGQLQGRQSSPAAPVTKVKTKKRSYSARFAKTAPGQQRVVYARALRGRQH